MSMHFPAIRFPVKSPVGDLFSGPYILTIPVTIRIFILRVRFDLYILSRIQGNRNLHSAVFTEKFRSLSFPFRAAGRTYAAYSIGIQLYQIDRIYPAFVCQSFPDIAPETSRQFSVRRSGMIFGFIFCDRSCNNDCSRLFRP